MPRKRISGFVSKIKAKIKSHKNAGDRHQSRKGARVRNRKEKRAAARAGRKERIEARRLARKIKAENKKGHNTFGENVSEGLGSVVNGQATQQILPELGTVGVPGTTGGAGSVNADGSTNSGSSTGGGFLNSIFGGKEDDAPTNDGSGGGDGSEKSNMPLLIGAGVLAYLVFGKKKKGRR